VDCDLTVLTSVSDPHTLNADPDPDPGLLLITDPGSGSRIPVFNPNQAKKIFLIAVISGISQQQCLAAEPYVIFRKTYLK